MTKEEKEIQKILAEAVENTGITNGINNYDINKWIVIEAIRIALSKASFISSKQPVSGRSEQLIDFIIHYERCKHRYTLPEEMKRLVDDYLKSTNCH